MAEVEPLFDDRLGVGVSDAAWHLAVSLSHAV
jgi:hypothetical protein